MNPLPSGNTCSVEAAGCWRRWVWLAACHLLVLSQAFGVPGDLDVSFGNIGKVTTAISSSSDYGYSVAVQSDGRIIVAGVSGNGRFALARYTPEGALDASFGNGGKVTTDVGYGSGQSVAVQSDGRIVLAGNAHNGSNYDFALVRYTAEGALDGSFGSGGKVLTAIGSYDDRGASVAVQSDGKIVVAGSTYDAYGSNPDFALVRYTAEGALDATFGSGGKVTTTIGSQEDYGRSVAVQGDGKIVVAGSSYNFDILSDDFALVRYTASGALDTSFGSVGKVVTAIRSYDDFGNSVAVQSDGKIVVAGISDVSGNYDFALARYTTSGALDTSFGSVGKVTTPIGSGTDSGNSVVVQSDGKIIVAGYSGAYPNGDFALARYTVAGVLDTSFGNGGKVIAAIGSGDDRGYGVAVQSDGKIVVAGYSANGGKYDFALARFEVSAGAPTVATLPATTISSTGATLRGVVNRGGSTTTGYFEYGTTTSYGSNANVTLSPSGQTIQNVSAAISGLTAGTTYHYRVTATNATGTSYSSDATFTTVSFNNVNLLSLALSSGTFSPAFSSDTTNYTASVPYSTTNTTVTPTAANSHAPIQVNGVAVASGSTSGAISLAIGNNTINVLVTAEDGTATKTYTVSIWRVAPVPGNLDVAFGSGGKVTTAIGSGADNGQSVAVQSDGKIVVAGSSSNGSNNDFALVRYTAAGALDAGFGIGGKSTTLIGTGDDYGQSVAVQSDGKIVVAGYSSNGSNYDFALVRYTATGALDTGFGSGGKVTTDFASNNDSGYSLALQSDGKIVVAGGTYNGSNYDFALVRYTTEGALDASFGNGGKVTTAIGTFHDNGGSVAVQSDGKIIVAGSSFNNGYADFALVRYTTEGGLDASFGNGGKVITDLGFHDEASSVAVQSDGKIVVAGRQNKHIFPGPGDPTGFDYYYFALVRYTAAGSVDASFGNGGKIITSISGINDGARSVALQSDGKIVVAGYSSFSPGIFSGDFTLVRYTTAGALDASFGSRVTDFGSNFDSGNSVVVQSDGKIVVAGSANGDFALARYHASGLASLANWRLTYFGTIENSGDAADGTAPDGDGIVNLLKYGLVIAPGTSGASSLPQGQRKVYAEGERFALVFLHDPARNDISLEVQAADDPEGPWATVASSAGGAVFSGAGFVSETGAGGGLNTVEVCDIVNLDAAPHRYMHIKVTH